ncbi:MAG TPA: MFS transporter, partial [Tepidisphaeraceae bacterium]|nr:MFS transporter [Tepidisphaeraceae bacterium]
MANGPKQYRVGTLAYTRPRLALLFFWLLWGDFCFNLMENVVPSILPLKLQKLGASNVTIGIILSTTPMLLNMILNPVIGFRSDRYRSRWGRRIPFIFVTLPFLVVCLLGLAFGDQIGAFLREALPILRNHFSSSGVALGVTGIMMILFSIFNTFVNSVFWYLFNDVVPEHLLARFMAWFRLIGMGAIALYNFFIFKYAGAYATQIMAGAAILYLFGFGLMCLNVREGEYPSPPENTDGQIGPIAAIKTYARECLALPHYWYIFLASICLGGVMASSAFMLFFYQSTGLTLAMIGVVIGVRSITTGVMVLGAGWLADRFHPIRVVIAGLLLQVLLAMPASLLWLFWRPSPTTSYWLWLILTIALIAPATALMTMLDPPLLMRIFPRSRFGQFCSANALWRSGSV